MPIIWSSSLNPILLALEITSLPDKRTRYRNPPQIPSREARTKGEDKSIFSFSFSLRPIIEIFCAFSGGFGKKNKKIEKSFIYLNIWCKPRNYKNEKFPIFLLKNYIEDRGRSRQNNLLANRELKFYPNFKTITISNFFFVTFYHVLGPACGWEMSHPFPLGARRRRRAHSL